MVRTISFSNLKGGVGKSTSAFNVAVALSMRGQRTLLLDIDAQANTSQSFGISDPEKHVYGVLLKEYDMKAALLKVRENLFLIPANKNLAAFEQNSNANVDGFYCLHEQLSNLTQSVKLDFIIIDCGPSLGLLTINAYVASSEILVPLECQSFSLTGLDEVKNSIYKIRKRLNPNLQLSGVFFTRHYKRKLISRKVKEIINQEYPNKLMNTSIRDCIQLKESVGVQLDVFTYSPNCNGSIDYMNLTNEIINMENYVK